MKIQNLFGEVEKRGMRSVSFPIVDVDAPPADEMAAFAAMVEELGAALSGGQTVVVHCRGGLGRSGTVAAACLVKLGLSVNEAMAAVRSARPGAIEVATQEDWVTRYSGFIDGA